jgi:hypothetical protein
MRNTILFILALLFATWFVLTGWVWFYFYALVFSYPFALLALLFWFIIRSDKKKRNIAIPIVLGVGLLSSLSVLVGLLVTN